MKKVIIVVVVGIAAYVGLAHLEHAIALDGYMQGCRDVINEGAEQVGLQVPDNVVDSYCHSLMIKYDKKK